MEICRFDEVILQQLYNVAIGMFALAPPQNFFPHLSWIVIEPHQTSYAHCHHEHEIFIVCQGKPLVDKTDETFECAPGDTIKFLPFEKHSFINKTSSQVLLLSMVWENLTEIKEAEPTFFKDKMLHLITSTPPTPNGDLHLGHISGPYLRADIYSRFLRANGQKVLHITNTDDYQSYTAYKGQQQGQNADEVAAYYAQEIRTSLAALAIIPDEFTQSSVDLTGKQRIQNLFIKLYEQGKIISKKTASLYCESCQRYLYEVYVTGNCPHCGTATRGTLCESCGKINDCQDLENRRCCCGTLPVVKEIHRLFFPLEPYRNELLVYYHSLECAPHVLHFINELFQTRLPDMPVSHKGNWGIPVDLTAYDDQIISVWFEMGLRHLLVIKNTCEQKIETAQFFGFDNSFFNVLLFPATFIALDQGDLLPRKLIMNYFYHLEGKKFSTSRQHAIWAKEFSQQYPVDLIRFYLSAKGPEQAIADFTRSEFIGYLHHFIVQQCFNWIRNVDDNLSLYFDKTSPCTGLWLSSQREFYKTIISTHEKITAWYLSGEFYLQKICKLINDFVEYADGYSAEVSLLNRGYFCDEQRTAMSLQLLAVKAFSLWISPIMPQLGQNLRNNLGLPNRENYWEDHLSWVSKGTRIPSLKDNFNESIRILSQSMVNPVSHDFYYCNR